MSVKTYGGCSGGRNSQSHRRVHWRDPQGPRMYTNLSTRNEHQKGPISLWVVKVQMHLIFSKKIYILLSTLCAEYMINCIFEN